MKLLLIVALVGLSLGSAQFFMGFEAETTNTIVSVNARGVAQQVELKKVLFETTHWRYTIDDIRSRETACFKAVKTCPTAINLDAPPQKSQVKGTKSLIAKFSGMLEETVKVNVPGMCKFGILELVSKPILQTTDAIKATMNEFVKVLAANARAKACKSDVNLLKNYQMEVFEKPNLGSSVQMTVGYPLDKLHIILPAINFPDYATKLSAFNTKFAKPEGVSVKGHNFAIMFYLVYDKLITHPERVRLEKGSLNPNPKIDFCKTFPVAVAQNVLSVADQNYFKHVVEEMSKDPRVEASEVLGVEGKAMRKKYATDVIALAPPEGGCRMISDDNNIPTNTVTGEGEAKNLDIILEHRYYVDTNDCFKLMGTAVEGKAITDEQATACLSHINPTA